MEFGIFNLMGAREPEKPASQVFSEVAEQTRLADELGYTVAWFAEHHFSNYCLCASPLMMVAHCAAITKKIRLGTAVVVLPLYNPARLAAEIATADALSNGRLMLGIGAGYQPYEFERFGVDIAQNFTMTDEFCEILDRALTKTSSASKGSTIASPKRTSLFAARRNRSPSTSRVTRRRCSGRPHGAAIGCSHPAASAASSCWPNSMRTSWQRMRPRTCRSRERTSRSIASPTSPAAARKACASPRTHAISRGSPRACDAARKSCRAPCSSTCRFLTSRRSRRSTTIS